MLLDVFCVCSRLQQQLEQVLPTSVTSHKGLVSQSVSQSVCQSVCQLVSQSDSQSLPKYEKSKLSSESHPWTVV